MKKTLFMLASSLMLIATACEPSVDNEEAFAVGLEKIEATSEGGVFQLPVTATQAARATVTYNSEEEGWIQLLPATLNGSGKIQVTIDPYDNPLEDRTATITVASGSESKEVPVVQKPAEAINLSVTALVTLDEARSYGVTVQSSKPWTAVKSEGADWFTITESGAAGGSKLTVTTTALTDFRATRDATVTVSAEGMASKVLKVSQGYGVLINGIIWAKYDVGQPGEFVKAQGDRHAMEVVPPVYQYNSNIPYTINGADTWETAENVEPEGWAGTPYNGTDSWYPENDPCPEGWRIPTNQEFVALFGATSIDQFNSPEFTSDKFAWKWFHYDQGVFVGNSDSMDANQWDTKGNIFMVRAGYRGNFLGAEQNWIEGIQGDGWRVWRQTEGRSVDAANWSRCSFVIAWSSANANEATTGIWWMDNPYAVAIRPVAELVSE